VIAEVILDSTSNDFQPCLDALLMPGLVMTYPPDVGNPVATELEPGRWQSCLPLNIAEMPRRLHSLADRGKGFLSTCQRNRGTSAEFRRK
jgi:hypothetical protein